jgi:regulator of sigma E protease
MLAFLTNAAIIIVPFLVIITFIVTIHELGHFLTARACGVAVDRFSIGFGRAIFSFKDRWGVEWRLAWLPLGGYVRFAGDENAASVPDQTDLDDLRTRIAAKEGDGAE